MKTLIGLRRLLDRSSSRWSASASRAWSAPASSAARYFEVMGLRPVLGRLLDRHRRWRAGRGRGGADPSLLDDRRSRAIRTCSARPSGSAIARRPSSACSSRRCRIPPRREIIANVVTSPHHLDATMVDGRVHRMTELFGRLAPGVDSRTGARRTARPSHGAMVTEHKEAYPPKAELPHRRRALRDQITSPARTILLVLLAASALIFVIACSNVANLILARSVRREGELAVRAALGASAGGAAADAAGRKPAAVRRRRRAGRR